MDNTYQGVILSPKVVPNLSRALVPDYLRRSSWGHDTYNQVTDTPLDTNFTAIAGGGFHSMALSVSAVPLPASAWMGLVLLGGMGVVGVMRRRMRSA